MRTVSDSIREKDEITEESSDDGIQDHGYRDYTSLLSDLIMIPFGKINDIATKREYQMIPRVVTNTNTFINTFKRGCGGRKQWGPVILSFQEDNTKIVMATFNHHKLGWCSYNRDIETTKHLDKVFINPRTRRVPYKVITYGNDCESDLGMPSKKKSPYGGEGVTSSLSEASWNDQSSDNLHLTLFC